MFEACSLNSIDFNTPDFNWLRRLAIVTLLFSLCVVILGAATRLKDAGLGCPDWPGCYGQLLVPQDENAILNAIRLYPHRPVEIHKAYYEMIHRYLAGSLGLLIVGLATITLLRHRQHRQLVQITLALVGVVLFQAALGMWTVTMQLFPPIVMGHLLGGFLTVSLLSLLTSRLTFNKQLETDWKTHIIARVALLLVIIQVALGGWTAANYAATVCTELPICEPGWWQHLNVIGALKFWGHDADIFEYAPHLTPDIKITIHAFHRIGAIFVGIWLLVLIIRLSLKADKLSRRWAFMIAALATIQIGLGIANVKFNLPLIVAVAHNLGGCLTIATLTVFNYAVLSCHHPKMLSSKLSANHPRS